MHVCFILTIALGNEGQSDWVSSLSKELGMIYSEYWLLDSMIPQDEKKLFDGGLSLPQISLSNSIGCIARHHIDATSTTPHLMLDLCLVGSSEGNRASAPDSRPLAARLWIRSIALDHGVLVIGSPRFEDEATKSWEARKVRSKRRFFRDTSHLADPSSVERGNDVYPRSIWEVKTGLGGLNG